MSILNQLMKILPHGTPFKHKRLKSSRLPVWYVPEIGKARKLLDKFKGLKKLNRI